MGDGSRRLRISFLTSYDIQSPRAGGGSAYVWAMAKHLATRHHVRIICGSDDGLASTRFSDGIEVLSLRSKGDSIALHFRVLCSKLLRNCDLVIESADVGGPWFAFSARQRMLLLHQLWREIFEMELRPPFGRFFKQVEPFFYLPYRKVPVVVQSESSAHSATALGLKRQFCIPPGLTTLLPGSGLPSPKATRHPVIVVVSRLRKYKGIQYAIRAVAELLRSLPDLELGIVGRGEYESELRALATTLGIRENVRFHGWLDVEERTRVLQNATLSIAPSVREGLGLNILESFACGTSCVAWNVPGSRDLIQDAHNGFLVPPFETDKLALAASRIISDEPLRLRLETNALEYSKRFRWDEAFRRFDNLVEEVAADDQLVRAAVDS